MQALDITSQQHLRKILFFPLYFVVFSKTVSIPAIAVLTYLYSFFQPHVPHVFPGSGPEPLRLTFRQLHVYPTCPTCSLGAGSRTSGADTQLEECARVLAYLLVYLLLSGTNYSCKFKCEFIGKTNTLVSLISVYTLF